MTLAQHWELEHQQCYNEGWNDAATSWEFGFSTLPKPQTSYTGDRRESYLEGFQASQESPLLNEKLNP
jgi:hypothetical protein